MSVTDATRVTGAVGRSLPRTEDRRLLQGEGTFTDDVFMRRMGYVHFLRSPHAHARILAVDVSRAEAIEGVYATLTGEEVEAMCEPFTQLAPAPGNLMRDYALAVGKVRFVGEPVVAVLAETRELARDAAELIRVGYEPLVSIVDGVGAVANDAPILHEEIGSKHRLPRHL